MGCVGAVKPGVRDHVPTLERSFGNGGRGVGNSCHKQQVSGLQCGGVCVQKGSRSDEMLAWRGDPQPTLGLEES